MKSKQTKAKTKASKPKKAIASRRQSKSQDKLDKIQVLDGKVNEKEELTSLEEILNPGGMFNPFKVSTDAELDTKIGDMTLPELQSLAVETGVFPSGNRTTLKNKLKREFNSRTHGKGKIMTRTNPAADFDKMTPEQQKLFKTI